MKIYRPDPKLVDLFTTVRKVEVDAKVCKDFFAHKEDWYKNHRSFVLQKLLPSIRPPLHVLRACIEGYLTDVDYNGSYCDFYIFSG